MTRYIGARTQTTSVLEYRRLGAQEYLLPAIVFPFLAGKHAAHSSSGPFPMQCVHILQSPSIYFQSLYRGAVPAKIYTQTCTWAGHGECNRQSHFQFLYQAVRIQGCLFSLVPDAVRRRPSQYCQTSRFTMSQPRKPVVYASIIIA